MASLTFCLVEDSQDRAKFSRSELTKAIARLRGNLKLSVGPDVNYIVMNNPLSTQKHWPKQLIDKLAQQNKAAENDLLYR